MFANDTLNLYLGSFIVGVRSLSWACDAVIDALERRGWRAAWNALAALGCFSVAMTIWRAAQ